MDNRVAGPAVLLIGDWEGGGFAFVNGKIIRIPPRGPIFRQARAATEMLAAADHVDDLEMKQALTTLGTRLAQGAAKKAMAEVPVE